MNKFDELFEFLHGCTGLAVVGGAVRDTLTDEAPIKDIDIVCSSMPASIRTKLRNTGLEETVRDTQYGSEYRYTGKILNEDVDIFVNTNAKYLYEFLSDFPIGLSQVAYTTNGLISTKLFMTDFVNCTLTCLSTCSEEYKKRISEKYPHRPVVDECIPKLTIPGPAVPDRL